jgi:Tfp pilus assembly protein PilN
MSWNPLRSEREMFRFLMQVGGVVLALIVIVVVLRAIL